MTPVAAGFAKLKAVIALAGLSGATLNARLPLQAPKPLALAARTFQMSGTFVGSAALLFHESLVMPTGLRTGVLPW